MHRGDNWTNFAWNRNRNERGNRKRNQDHIRNQLQQRGCQWIFQPHKASHASGVDRGKAHPLYSYRLTAILGNGLVDDEAMATSLTEVESILNPRPVCAISDDSSDPEPLTPNRLLLQRPLQTLPPGTLIKEALCVHGKSGDKWKSVLERIDQRVRPRVLHKNTRGAKLKMCLCMQIHLFVLLPLQSSNLYSPFVITSFSHTHQGWFSSEITK